jgi:hypothetical protein
MKFAKILNRDEMKEIMAGNVSGGDCRASTTCGYCEEKNDGVWQCSTCCIAHQVE